jgi:DNA-binding MarR family transcriptional regulator
MTSELSSKEDPRERRRRLAALTGSLRELNNQLSLLNRRVGARLALRDADLDCLDLLATRGPLGPKALAQLTGLHAATLTGVLDRLQNAGWVVRERDADGTDRRAISVRALPDRFGEVFGLYAGMNSAIAEVCSDYTVEELDVITDFLQRATAAGKDATAELDASGD